MIRAALAAALVTGCAAPAPPPPDPTPDTDWHREPVLAKALSANVVVYNHADASLRADTIAALLQRQYDYLRGYLGFAPRWVLVHVGARYPLGFAIPTDPPQMFLQAGSIFDTQANYAHEMSHCFHAYLGDLPHWFNESLADLLYFESEVELYSRRHEASFLDKFDRVDHRSYELMQLRRRYGAGYFRRVYRALASRLEECRATFRPETPLEERNRLILRALSEAAGEDVTPTFEREFGFNPRTRERQRGY